MVGFYAIQQINTTSLLLVGARARDRAYRKTRALSRLAQE